MPLFGNRRGVVCISNECITSDSVSAPDLCVLKAMQLYPSLMQVKANSSVELESMHKSLIINIIILIFASFSLPILSIKIKIKST